MSDTDDIYFALQSAKRAVESLESWQRRAEARDTVRSMAGEISRGMDAFERLKSQLRDGRQHIAVPEDFKATGCMCSWPNASPPCSWCTDPSRTEETDEAAAQAETAQAAPALVDLLMDAEEAEHIERAAGLLEGYVQFIKGHVMSADIEMHPYLPEIEEAAQELRSIVSRIGEFTPTSDYLFGHADGLEWAAQVVEANDPRTGDWLHDDRNDLAKALRKGPELPPVAAQAAPVAGLLSAEQWLHEIHKAAMYSGHKSSGVWDQSLANMIATAARQFAIDATPGATHGN